MDLFDGLTPFGKAVLVAFIALAGVLTWLVIPWDGLPWNQDPLAEYPVTRITNAPATDQEPAPLP